MSASNSIPPNNLLVLGIVGIAAYWFLTKRAAAAPLVTSAGLPGSPAAPSIANTLGGLAGAFTKLFNPGLSAGAQAQGAAVGAANAISDASYAGANWAAMQPLASSAVDGLPLNTPNGAPFDTIGMSYLSGSGSLGD